MSEFIIGVDLRGLSGLPGSGAGVAHATRELWETLLKKSFTLGIECIPLCTRKDFRKTTRAVIFPTGAVPIWFHGNAFPLVHDLFIFDYPEWFNQKTFHRLFTTTVFLRGLKRAVHIFAVSESTKNDIIRHAGIPPERISVVYQGVDSFKEDYINVMEPKEKYFLVLGTIEPRKNLNMLFKLVYSGDFPANTKLVIAGKNGWGNVKIPVHEQVVCLGEVSHEKKQQLIRNATALLLPSLSEGFGRSSLEAMSIGTPVIASNAGALSEVVDDCGILLDPQDMSAWKQAIHSLASDDQKRDELSKKGVIQSRKFTWEQTAGNILATIKSSC